MKQSSKLVADSTKSTLRVLMTAVCVVMTFLFLVFESIKAVLLYVNTVIDTKEDYITNSRTYMFVSILSSACLGFVLLIIIGLFIYNQA